MRKLILLLHVLVVSIGSQAQVPPFSAPVKIPLLLTGNFGELRSNHFHTGIDIKTDGKTGLPVYSAAQGYVSRINISAGGYGNALYITHPIGFTTVYGHLEAFSPEIEKWIKERQYEQEEFSINLNLDSTRFRVKKGELIAYSGNTGSSGGPHLHFEIRETKTEHPVNPLQFGFEIKDKIKPAIERLFVYALSDNGHVENAASKTSFKTVFYDGAYHLHGRSVINAYGEIGFGLQAIDYMDGTWSKCGIYKTALFVDGIKKYECTLDELSYDKIRYMNSHVDYEEEVLNYRKIYRTYIQPNNQLEIYSNVVDKGIINCTNGEKHEVEIVLWDKHGNKSKLNFRVKSVAPKEIKVDEPAAFFSYQTSNYFKNEAMQLYVPKGALYDNLKFTYSEKAKPTGAYSALHQIHNNYTPLQIQAEIKIKADSLPSIFESKALLVRINPKTEKVDFADGEFSDGWVSLKTTNLGNYTIRVDTIAPTISPLSIKQHKTLMERNRIRFKIEDELAGIKKYVGTIDGNWVLFQYDAKSDMLTYEFDAKLQKGKQHHLELKVTDKKENTATYSASFYW